MVLKIDEQTSPPKLAMKLGTNTAIAATSSTDLHQTLISLNRPPCTPLANKKTPLTVNINSMIISPADPCMRRGSLNTNTKGIM